MAQSYPLKNLPAPAQLLIRPMLFISLGLHGLLLFLPFASNKNPVLAKKEQAVKITQLPPVGKSAPKSTSKLSTKPRPSTRQSIALNRPRVVVPRRQADQTRANSAAKQANRPRAAQPATATAGTNSPFADFPHYPGAEPGCFGKDSCRQAAAPLDQVVMYFTKELPAKKYEIQPDTSEAERKVYQVSKGGTVQYLNLFANEGGTAYVLSDKPLKVADIKKAVEVPGELYAVLGELGDESVDDTAFTDPTQFYSKLSSEDADGSILAAEPNPAIDGSPKLVAGQTPDKVMSDLQPKLQSNGIEVSDSGTYGGGSLYQMKKGAFTGYINLVPTKDRTGTIVVVWTSSPV